MTRRRRTWWLVGFLLVSLFVAILLTVKQQETLFTGLEYAAFREACARAPASEIPFWTEAGINCRITTSNIWLLLFNWSAVLAFLAGVAVLAGSVWLLVRHSYRMAQVGAVPDAPWFWRDTAGFGLGLVPFGLAVGVVEMRIFSALLALPAGMAGSFLFAWLLARLRSRRMFTLLPPAAAVATASAPARESVRPEPACSHSMSTALCQLPFTPVRSTIPIPPGLLLVKDEDGPPAPLWERLIGSGTERQLGPAKELRLDYGFELSYPVTVLEYLLCCWHGGAESVGQLGSSRSHHLRDFTFAHLVRLIFDWPLYQLGRYRLQRALLPYYRSGCSLNRNRWIFPNATLQEDSYRREQALREVQAEHPWLNRPVGNVDWRGGGNSRRGRAG